MTAAGATQGRPVIGLSTYREQAAWSVWNMSADLLPSGYTRSVEAAGATYGPWDIALTSGDASDLVIHLAPPAGLEPATVG